MFTLNDTLLMINIPEGSCTHANISIHHLHNTHTCMNANQRRLKLFLWAWRRPSLLFGCYIRPPPSSLFTSPFSHSGHDSFQTSWLVCCSCSAAARAEIWQCLLLYVLLSMQSLSDTRAHTHTHMHTSTSQGSSSFHLSFSSCRHPHCGFSRPFGLKSLRLWGTIKKKKAFIAPCCCCTTRSSLDSLDIFFSFILFAQIWHIPHILTFNF